MEEVNKKREQAEALVYKVMDALDPTKAVSSHYQEIFSKMDDNTFIKYVSKEFPFKFYYKPFVIEPKMDNIMKALKILNVPLVEEIQLPYLYEDKDGNAVSSMECPVVYMHIKKMKQFITKKNSTPVNITNRDMKTGLLMSDDKGGKESDREVESLNVLGLSNTQLELARPRADSMNAKSQMYNIISQTGRVSLNDIEIKKEDSLSKNLIDTYLIGSLLKSNLIIDDSYMTTLTRESKNNNKIERK